MSAGATALQPAAAACLDEALHDLAQPLTALLFAIERARLSDDPAQWRAGLAAASVETARATQALYTARNLLHGGE